MMQYAVYAILSICCTGVKVLIMAWRDGKGLQNFLILEDGSVDDEKVRMRGHEGNHHEKLKVERISCVSQLTIHNTADTYLDWTCNNTNMISSQCNEESHTPDFPYPLVFSRSFSCSSPISVFHILTSIIIAEHKITMSLFNSPCHNHELTLSIAYTEYSIHQVQHTPSIASTQDCLFSIHCHDYKLTPKYSFSFQLASLND